MIECYLCQDPCDIEAPKETVWDQSYHEAVARNHAWMLDQIFMAPRMHAYKAPVVLKDAIAATLVPSPASKQKRYSPITIKLCCEDGCKDAAHGHSPRCLVHRRMHHNANHIALAKRAKDLAVKIEGKEEIT